MNHKNIAESILEQFASSYSQVDLENLTEVLKDISSETTREFEEYIKSQMKERDYMGIKYKQGVFSDRDIETFANEFIAKKFGAEVE